MFRNESVSAVAAVAAAADDDDDVLGGQSFYNANAASIGSRLATVGHLETTAVTTGAVVGSSPGSRLASGDSATAPPSVNNTMSATTAGATMKSEMGGCMKLVCSLVLNLNH